MARWPRARVAPRSLALVGGCSKRISWRDRLTMADTRSAFNARTAKNIRGLLTVLRITQSGGSERVANALRQTSSCCSRGVFSARVTEVHGRSMTCIDCCTSVHDQRDKRARSLTADASRARAAHQMRALSHLPFSSSDPESRAATTSRGEVRTSENGVTRRTPAALPSTIEVRRTRCATQVRANTRSGARHVA